MSKLVTRIARSSGHRLLRSSSAATASGQPQRKPFHTGTARLIFEPTYLDVSISSTPGQSGFTSRAVEVLLDVCMYVHCT